MLLYATAKFVAYTLWCWIGLRWLARTHAGLAAAAKFGAVRWLLGLGFGLVAAIAVGSVNPESVARLYFVLYTPLRVFEWTIMAMLIHRHAVLSPAFFRGGRVWLWILGGIAVSFASDLASPEGMAGRFCVGRCLC